MGSGRTIQFDGRKSRHRRAALALTISVGLLAALLAFGGIGLAASSAPGDGAKVTAADTQYQYPGWFCFRKRHDDKGFKYALFYAPSPGNHNGWEVVAYYGANPGQCPP